MFKKFAPSAFIASLVTQSACTPVRTESPANSQVEQIQANLHRQTEIFNFRFNGIKAKCGFILERNYSQTNCNASNLAEVVEIPKYKYAAEKISDQIVEAVACVFQPLNIRISRDEQLSTKKTNTIIVGGSGHPGDKKELLGGMAPYDAGNLSDHDAILIYQSSAFSAEGSVRAVNFPYSLAYTTVHEIGHALGLDHNPVEASVMGKESPRGVVFSLSEAEILMKNTGSSMTPETQRQLMNIPERCAQQFKVLQDWYQQEQGAAFTIEAD
jgi:hypothetical protein